MVGLRGWGAQRWIGSGAIAIAIAGCSASDSAGAQDSVSGSTDGGQTPEDTTVTGPGIPPDTDTDAGESGDEGSSTGDGAMNPDPADGTGDSDGFGCELACGNGVCTVENDVEVCECDDGYAFNGATCVSCVEAPSALDLDTATVRLHITLDGAAAPGNAGEYGRISLRNRQTGDRVELGDTRQPELTGSVLAADYDVFYSHVVGTVVPANQDLRIATITAQDELALEIDIPTVEIAGAFLFDGGAAPQSVGESGRIKLRDRETGGETTVGLTNGQSYALVVAPGTYDAVYEAIGAGAVAPANRHRAFGKVAISADDDSLDFDVPTVSLSGDFMFDGVEAPASASESGHISLQAGDDVVDLGDTNGGAFDVRVIPGEYEVVYEARAGSAVAPGNTRAVISTLTLLPGEAMSGVAIDVETVLIDGAFTFNGAPAPDDPTDDGLIVLRHANGDEVVLGYTSGGSYARRVVRGEYEVHYVQDSSRSAAPRNTNARLTHLSALAPANIDIDVPTVALAGDFTVGGATPPASDYEDGLVYLRDAETGDSVLLGNTRNGGYAAPVVPGIYDVLYVADTPGGPLPVNTGAVIGTLDLAAAEPVAVAIDVPAVAITGAIMVDGDAPPISTHDVGDLYLVDAVTREQLYLASTADGGFAQTLTPGAYLVHYRMLSSTGLVPINANASLGCWQVK